MGIRILTKTIKDNIVLNTGEEEIFNDILNEESYEIEELKEELGDTRDTDTEFADGLCNPYTADLLEWYREDLDRVYYMEEAIELGAKDGFEILAWGQVEYYREKINEVISKIEEYIEGKHKFEKFDKKDTWCKYCNCTFAEGVKLGFHYPKRKRKGEIEDEKN